MPLEDLQRLLPIGWEWQALVQAKPDFLVPELDQGVRVLRDHLRRDLAEDAVDRLERFLRVAVLWRLVDRALQALRDAGDRVGRMRVVGDRRAGVALGLRRRR